jgi:hypothetical protein
VEAEEEQFPGWDALDEALARVYGGREPDFHYGTAAPLRAGGEDPLDGISVYAVDGHWHYVSYGLSELYEKETDEPEVSGFGFELTLRVARGDEAEPPAWALAFLQKLARYVFDTGNVLDVGHQFDTEGPLAPGVDTRMHAVVIARDPQLPRLTTPFGRVDFLQVVGVTDDEYELLKDWGTESLLAALAERDPLLVTDLHRPSLLADPKGAAELRARVERDGSSLGGVFVAHATFARRGSRITLELGAAAVDDVLRLLKGRTSYQRDFFVKGDAAVVWIKPGARAAAEIEEDALTVTLDRAAAEELRRTLAPRRGRYALAGLPSLEIEVVPSQLRDRDGKVVRVVG